jgi:hypothetical protein
MVAKLKAIKVELQRRMHDRMAEVGAWLRKVVLGYYQYHAVPGVCPVLCVNDLGFVVGLGFDFVVGFGDGLQGKGAFPLPLHIHVEESEIALC